MRISAAPVVDSRGQRVLVQRPGQAGNGRELVQSAIQVGQDEVLLDRSQLDEVGGELVGRLAQAGPGLVQVIDGGIHARGTSGGGGAGLRQGGGGRADLRARL